MVAQSSDQGPDLCAPSRGYTKRWQDVKQRCPWNLAIGAGPDCPLVQPLKIPWTLYESNSIDVMPMANIWSNAKQLFRLITEPTNFLF